MQGTFTGGIFLIALSGAKFHVTFQWFFHCIPSGSGSHYRDSGDQEESSECWTDCRAGLQGAVGGCSPGQTMLPLPLTRHYLPVVFFQPHLFLSFSFGSWDVISLSANREEAENVALSLYLCH